MRETQKVNGTLINFHTVIFRGQGWGGGVKVQKYTSAITVERYFFFMTIADSPPLGQSASGLNFYDYSRRSLLAD